VTMTAVYLEAAATAAELIGSPDVAARWDEPSALSEMTVGALAGHLAGQITRVPAVLTGSAGLPGDPPPPPDPVLFTLDQHYSRSRWVGAPLDDAANVGIRRQSAAAAAGGQEELVGRTEAVIAELRETLPDADGSQPVYLPWAGWSLTLDDFLTTRLLEIVVHVDDLAVSVGVTPPALPDEAIDTVLTLLTHLAARRHGTPAVLRALTRQERAPATITAF
jgi:Mycothiol maleylpyruvate isomerase N-terminal domain